jgi:hypothetical protein
MLVHIYTAVSVTLCIALNVNLCMQFNVKRMLDLPFAHITADLVRGHTALVKPSRKEGFAEYVGQQHVVLPTFKFKARLLTASLLRKHDLDKSAEIAVAVHVACNFVCLILPV